MAASAQDAHPWPIYNARFRVVFPILDADGDLVTAAAALDSELSQDQGTFVDAANEATEIATSSGMYYLDLIATELDTKSTAIIVKTTTTGAKTTPIVLYPKRLPVVRTGTAQAGAASTVTLDAGASALDDYYKGCYINITNDLPANVLGQARRITGYVGSTKVATIEGTWGTNPSVASTFEILAPGDTVNLAAWAGSAVSDPTAAGLPEVDVLRFGGAAGTFAAGRPEVNTSHLGGTLQTAGDIIARLGTPTGASVSADIAAIEAQTDDIGIAGAGLTAVPWNAAWDAEVESEALDALNTILADSIPADGTLPTVRQALYLLTQFMLERAVASTTVTVKKADGITTLFTLTLDSATAPTSITRAT